MNSAELKIELFRKIEQLSDKNLLKAYLLLNNFLQSFTVGKVDNEKLNAKIDAALHEIEKGNYRTHTEVMSNVKKRFGIG